MRTIGKFINITAALTLGIVLMLLTATQAAGRGYGLASFDGFWSCSGSFSAGTNILFNDGTNVLFNMSIPQETTAGSISGMKVNSDGSRNFKAQINLSEIMEDGSGVITVGPQSPSYPPLPSALYFNASSDGFMPAPMWTGLAGQSIEQAGSMTISGIFYNPQAAVTSIFNGDCERQ